jgi:hypothetical protein
LVSREGACENGHCGDCSAEMVKGIVMESSEPAAAAGKDIGSAVGACGKGRGEEGKQENDGDGEDCAWLRVYISWRGSMEIARVAASENSTVGDICSAMLCEPEVDPDHKLLVFNGLLLEREWGALSVGIFDSCVLHLVLSDAPYKGRVLYVKGSLGPVEVRCDDTFLIEDVKQAASCFPGMPPVESQRISFCGRILQDEHTLRQYNIQKPCVLNLLPSGGGSRGRGIENFVKSSSPECEEHNVPLDRQLEVQMTSVMSDESHYHGMMLGSPDLSTLTHDDVELVHVSSRQALDGTLLIDPDSRLVTFTPSQPLREASHYRLTVNSRAPLCQTATGGARDGAREWHRPGGAVGLMHSKGGEEPVHGRYVSALAPLLGSGCPCRGGGCCCCCSLGFELRWAPRNACNAVHCILNLNLSLSLPPSLPPSLPLSPSFPPSLSCARDNTFIGHTPMMVQRLVTQTISVHSLSSGC